MLLDKIKTLAINSKEEYELLEKTGDIFSWISEIATEKDRILLVNNLSEEIYYYTFPRKISEPPKKIKKLTEKEPLTFIISQKNKITPKIEDGWVPIFTSQIISVYENTKRHKINLPLRFGLTSDEKKEALSFARLSLERFLRTGFLDRKADTAKLSTRFFMYTDIDVALWVNGHPRGSYIIENQQLHEAIRLGISRASRDSRFKPLAISELENTQIEIGIMSSLKIPLQHSELEKKEFIQAEKGFLLKHREKKGWLLPAAFNVRNFSKFNDFLQYLSEIKAGINYRTSNSQSQFYQFEIDGFIENNKGGYNKISGSIAKSSQPLFNSISISAEKAALQWVMKMQENDGNIRLAIDPLSGTIKQYDILRSSFTMGAVAEYIAPSIELKTNYLGQVESNFLYIKKLLNDATILKPLLSYCYGSFEGMVLWKLTGDKTYLENVNNWVEILLKESFENEDAITVQQASSLLLNFSKHNPQIKPKALEVAQIAKKQFLSAVEKGAPIQLAMFAELINTFSLCEKIEKGKNHYKFALEVADWLISNQFSYPNDKNGIFPATTAGGLPYTRGVGKIAETLPIAIILADEFGLDDMKYREALEKTMLWIEEMQYNDENVYFVTPEGRESVIGGIRHDMVNTEAWIDSVGHYLLALSRIRDKKIF